MWVKRNVVMLPTNKKAIIYTDRYGNLKLHSTESTLPLDSIGKNQHLYILSDEEVNEGEYGIDVRDSKIFKCERLLSNHYEQGILQFQKSYCCKIIATTDTSLGLLEVGKAGYSTEEFHSILPLISQQFIEKYIEEYNKGNSITEVDVEYFLLLEPGNTLNDRKYDKTILKVNLDNTINIKSAKNSWTKDEVIELLHKSLDANIVFNNKFNEIFHEQLDEWIKENL